MLINTVISMLWNINISSSSQYLNLHVCPLVKNSANTLKTRFIIRFYYLH